MLALGVDLNGVIRARKSKGTSEQRPEVDGAIEGLIRLREEYFGDRIYIVSKSEPYLSIDRSSWLEERDFFARTGISRPHVIYCPTRADKSTIAHKLALTHFIDDRLEVLGPMAVRHRFLFQPRAKEVRRYRHHLDAVAIASSWDELVDSICDTLLLAAA